MTTKSDIRGWLARRVPEHTHMLVVTDTFDYTDYPVFCKGNVDDKIKEYQDYQRMSKVTEVYNLNMDIEKQLNEYRAWNL